MTTAAVTTIRADVLKGLLTIAAKQDVRYYLCGIYFDTDNGALVSTDGHKMLAVKCELPKNIRPFILPRSTCEQAIKLTTKRANELKIEIDAEGTCRRVQIRNNSGATCMGPESDGRFPDWRRVVPTECNGETAQFDGAYTEQLQDAFRLVTNAKVHPAIIHNGCGASLVICRDLTVLGILMPVRCDEGDSIAWRTASLKSFGFEAAPKAQRKAA